MKFIFKYSFLWIFILIFISGTFLRFMYLNQVPGGISDDELDSVLTAQSIYYSGTSLEGIFSPYTFKPAPAEAKLPYARAPYMLFAPFAGLVSKGLMGAKIPYVAISVLSMLVLAAIAWKLLGRRIALYTLFVSAFNPWSIYFGRTAFDTPLAVFFAYVYIFCLLYLKNWWILLAYLPWVFGLYSYQGTIIIYPFILIIGTYGIWRLRNHIHTTQYIIVTVIGLITFCVFMLGFSMDRAGTRIGEIATPNNPMIVSRVNDGRRRALQSWTNSFFINRQTVSTWQILGQYVGAFSTKHLFATGEDRSTFSLWTHGLFYPIELILLIFGVYYAYIKHKNISFFLLSIILISPIPAAISMVGVSYALRASLMYPALCIFIAIGIESLHIDQRSYFLRRLAVVILYIIMISNFAHMYFIRNPVNNSEGFGFSNRILAKYMRLALDNNSKTLFIGNNVINTFRQYVFYNNVLNKTSISAIQKSIRNNEFKSSNAEFIECPEEIPDSIEKFTVITPAGKTCGSISLYKEDFDPVIIANLGDSGRIYEIYNDSVCIGYSLSKYQPMIVLSDLDVEKMSAKKFCETYISKPL